VGPSWCLWDAPDYFTTKVPLKEVYSSSFNISSTELGHMAGFFRDTLSINDINWHDVVSELEELQHQQSITVEVAKQLFSIIAEKSPAEEDGRREMR